MNNIYVTMKYIQLFEIYTNASDRKPLFVDEHGKNIIYDNGDGIMIAVDDIEDAHYITLWDMNKTGSKKVGFLGITSSKMFFKGKTYNNLDSVEIDRQYRGRGYGYMLYKTALKFLNNNSDGIVSYLPDRVNKKEVPSIYKKFKNEIIDDYHIINR